jgi:7 transmembrane receptor (rhodopsin family)
MSWSHDYVTRTARKRINIVLLFRSVWHRLISWYIHRVADCSQIYCIVEFLFWRFLGISKPVKESLIKVPWAIIIILLIWLLNSVCTSPLFIWSDLKVDSANKITSCAIVHVDPLVRGNYITGSRIFTYWTPLIITWICYIGIIYKTKSSLNKVYKLCHLI